MSHFSVRIYVVVSGPLRNSIFVHSFCKRFRPLAAASYKHLHKYLTAFYSRVSRRDTSEHRSFPTQPLEASRRKDHVVSEVITHVKFVCKNLSD